MEKCPKLIDGIECKRFFEKKQADVYCVGSIKKDKYFFLKEDVIKPCTEALARMDGKQTLEDIEILIRKSGYASFYIQPLYKLCLKSGFIENDKICSKDKDFNEFESMFKTIWTFKLDKINTIIRKIKGKVCISCIMLMCICILCAGVGMIYQSPKLPMSWERVGADFRAIIYFVFASVISVLLHEMSHNIVAVKCGLSPPNLRVAAFAYISLCFYVKIPGIYYLKPYKRMCIWGAGAFTNLFLLSISYLGIILFDNQAQLFCLAMFVCNLSLIIAALTPFYLSDGYFILSTVCKAPNLRKNAWKNFLLFFKSGKLEDGQLCYIVYFVITFVITAGFFFMFFYNIGGGIINKY